MKTLRFAFLAALACAACADPASGQTSTTYTWTNTSTNVGATTSWSPTGFPGSGGTLDLIQFNVLGTFGTTQQFNPTLSNVTAAVSGTSLSTTANFTGWAFAGTGLIAQTSITTYGPVTHTLNGPSILGIPAGSLPGGQPPADLPLTVTVTNGSTLAIQGTSTIAGTLGVININGGTLRLDNSTTDLPNRLPTTAASANAIKMQGGGTFELIGGSSGGTYNVAALNTQDNSVGGANTIRVAPNSTTAPTVLTFANAGTFSLRQGTRNVTVFEATSGALGDVNGAQIKFVGSPFVSSAAGSLLSNSATGATVGWATVKDSFGVNFATYNATNGIISIANPASGVAITTQTDTIAGINSGATNFQVNLSAGTTATANANVVGTTLRVTPSGAGATLAMGTNTLNVAALMLDGPNSLTITGTGNFGPGSGSRYIYVNNPNATLFTSQVVTTAGNPTIFVGPGFVVLTGTGSQNAESGTGNARQSLVGGVVLRASNTQFNFVGNVNGGATGGGVLDLTGGVLEITGGTNGSGESADFRRPLGTGAGGTVNWGGGTTAEQGSGGFSAFGSNASVNIGGQASPTPLTWNQTNFVGDGYALKFGSTQSNATLTWQNPIALDGGTAGNYALREINVTRGAGTAADKTTITGVISGSTSTDLIKTGNGVLELTAANTYRGNTLIQGGTLVIENRGSLGTAGSPTGNVVVGKGAMLAGAADNTISIALGAGNAVIVNPGGTIRGGNPTGGVAHLNPLNVGGVVTLNSSATDNAVIQVEAAPSFGPPVFSIITTTGAGNGFNLNPGAGKIVIDLVNGENALGLGQSYAATLALVDGANGGKIRLNGVDLDPNTVIDPSNYILQSSSFTFTGVSLAVDNAGTSLIVTFTPVPEPATVLGIAAASLGLGAVSGRRRAK